MVSLASLLLLRQASPGAARSLLYDRELRLGLAWAPAGYGGRSTWHTMYDSRGPGGTRRRRRQSLTAGLRSRPVELRILPDGDITSRHFGPLASLAVEQGRGRLLLSGGGDGSVSLYDLEKRRAPSGRAGAGAGAGAGTGAAGRSGGDSHDGGAAAAAAGGLRPVAHRRGIARAAPSLPAGVRAPAPGAPLATDGQNGHTNSVSSLAWYPVDEGLFVSSGLDAVVKVWSSERLQVEASFRLAGRVYEAAMSPVATHHALIAAATASPEVRLCDILSGATTHTLTGHRQAVLAAKWSPEDPHLLATAGADRSIRLWDIRRSGATACVAVLDMHRQYSGGGGGGGGGSGSGGEGAGGAGGDLLASVEGGAMGDQSESARGGYGGSSRSSSSSSSSSSAGSGLSAHDQAFSDSPNIGGGGGSASSEIAHHGAVTSLCFTPDGQFLLSSGSDSRIRLWDMATGLNRLVHYPSVSNRQAKQPRQMTVAQFGGGSGGGGSVLFHPNGTDGDLHVYGVHAGRLLHKVSAHYGAVNACAVRDNGAECQELITAGQDGLLLAWACTGLPGQGGGLPGPGAVPWRDRRTVGRPMGAAALAAAAAPVPVPRRSRDPGLGGGGRGVVKRARVPRTAPLLLKLRGRSSVTTAATGAAPRGTAAQGNVDEWSDDDEQ